MPWKIVFLALFWPKVVSSSCSPLVHDVSPRVRSGADWSTPESSLEPKKKKKKSAL